MITSLKIIVYLLFVYDKAHMARVGIDSGTLCKRGALQYEMFKDFGLALEKRAR